MCRKGAGEEIKLGRDETAAEEVGIFLILIPLLIWLRRVNWELVSRRFKKVISRVAGIEPTQTVLKTVVLPLNYTPLNP